MKKVDTQVGVVSLDRLADILKIDTWQWAKDYLQVNIIKYCMVYHSIEYFFPKNYKRHIQIFFLFLCKILMFYVTFNIT